MKKDHTIGYLIEKLRDKGIIDAKTIGGARQTINYWTREERLKLRRRPISNYRVVNDKEVEEILEAFSPGGKGYYFAKGTQEE